MFIDTHSHLNFSQFKKDLNMVVGNAREAGVERMIVVGSDYANSLKAIKIAAKYRGLYAAAGIHPIHIRSCFGMAGNDNLPPSIWTDDYNLKRERKISIKQISELLDQKKVVALGEIGFDYHFEGNGPRANKEAQKVVFSAFLNLAKEKGLPVIIHSRESIEDFFDIARNEGEIKGVMHCFQGDVIDAKRVFKLGLLISFTGLITFSRDYDEVIKFAPLDKIMIETDCPFLTPEPHRGERNEPAFVVEAARRIAEIKDIPLYKVAEATSKNAIDLFGLEKISSSASGRDIRETTPRQL